MDVILEGYCALVCFVPLCLCLAHFGPRRLPPPISSFSFIIRPPPGADSLVPLSLRSSSMRGPVWALGFILLLHKDKSQINFYFSSFVFVPPQQGTMHPSLLHRIASPVSPPKQQTQRPNASFYVATPGGQASSAPWACSSYPYLFPPPHTPIPYIHRRETTTTTTRWKALRPRHPSHIHHQSSSSSSSTGSPAA